MRTMTVICAAVGFAAGLAAAKAPYPPVQVLLQGGETVLGQPIAYPSGAPQLTAAIVTMQPGDETGWHRHDAPLLAYVLEGQLAVDYGRDGRRTYRAGDALLEAVGTEHNGRNTAEGTTRILAVFIGAEGVANTVMRAQ